MWPNPQFPADLVTFTVEILNEKLHFLCSVCGKAILENCGTLKSVPDCYKNQEICHKTVDNYPHPLEFVPQCHKTQKINDKAVETYPSTIKFSHECLWLKKCVIK